MQDDPALDNVVWHALNGHQKHFSEGNDRARRFAHGFSPIVGFPDPFNPDFDALRPYCDLGEKFFCVYWTGEPPSNVALNMDTKMQQMVYAGQPSMDDDALDAIPLTADHAQQALDLALLTKPGPFGVRTIELGDYFGYFEDGRLIAMAGERMHVGKHREISGVCTHPSVQGRGLAGKLMRKMMHRGLKRGEIPWLHVYSHNEVGVHLYEKLGFRIRRESPVRVIEFKG